RFHVQLGGTPPCLLRGADKLIALCRERIGEQQHVTADGKLSWIEVECLGACVNAPVMQVNYDYYEDLTSERLHQILDDLTSGRKVTPGPQVARQFSAPFGGPTTLTDPDLYAREKADVSARGEPATDDEAKKPGAAADVRDAAVPRPPVGDSSAKGHS